MCEHREHPEKLVAYRERGSFRPNESCLRLADLGGHKINLLTFRFSKLFFQSDPLVLGNLPFSLLLSDYFHALTYVRIEIQIVFPSFVRAFVQHSELVAAAERVLAVEVQAITLIVRVVRRDLSRRRVIGRSIDLRKELEKKKIS